MNEPVSGRYLVTSLVLPITIRVEPVREEMQEAVPSPRIADIFRIGSADLVVQPVPDLVGDCPLDPHFRRIADNGEPDTRLARVDEAQQRLVDPRFRCFQFWIGV